VFDTAGIKMVASGFMNCVSRKNNFDGLSGFCEGVGFSFPSSDRNA
jgi:hypothetical protein